MNIVMMLGKQAGMIGLLTVLAKKHNVVGVVCYDDMTTSVSNDFHIPVFKSIKDKEFGHAVTNSQILLSVAKQRLKYITNCILFMSLLLIKR